MNWKVLIFSVLIAFLAGFFLGRGKIRRSVKTEYIKGETVVRPVKIPSPSTVFIPTLYFLPTKRDTLYLDGEAQFVQTVDTAKIIEEYITENTYEFNVFDDSNGKLDITQTIQYNRLNDFNYTFTPIYRHTTVTEKPIFEPFISIGYSTFNQAFIGGGMFYKDVGIEYNYIHSNTLGGHSLSLKYKF